MTREQLCPRNMAGADKWNDGMRCDHCGLTKREAAMDWKVTDHFDVFRAESLVVECSGIVVTDNRYHDRSTGIRNGMSLVVRVRGRGLPAFAGGHVVEPYGVLVNARHEYRPSGEYEFIPEGTEVQIRYESGQWWLAKTKTAPFNSGPAKSAARSDLPRSQSPLEIARQHPAGQGHPDRPTD